LEHGLIKMGPRGDRIVERSVGEVLAEVLPLFFPQPDHGQVRMANQGPLVYQRIAQIVLDAFQDSIYYFG